MHRFTDVESTNKRLPQIQGYLTHQLLPLEKSLEPVYKFQTNGLDHYIKIAENRCHFPSEHGLTKDESAAIYLYTMEWGLNSLYRELNRALRAEDRSKIKPWVGYLRLFNEAVQKLPTVKKNLWRGIKSNVASNYENGDEFTWWSISSCTTSVNIIKDFLGVNSTLFLIEAVNGKNISRYACHPNEDEVILRPGARLRVVGDTHDEIPMRIIHLEEISNEHSKVEPAGGAEPFRRTERRNQETIIDIAGNRYETNIHIFYGFR